MNRTAFGEERAFLQWLEKNPKKKKRSAEGEEIFWAAPVQGGDEVGRLEMVKKEDGTKALVEHLMGRSASK